VKVNYKISIFLSKAIGLISSSVYCLIIIIIGVWILSTRKCQAEGRRKRTDLQYWKIKNKTFDEKTDVKPHYKDVAGLEGAKKKYRKLSSF
jgi:ATP-dependent Zn protease